MNPSVCFRIEAPPHEVERLIAELHSLGTLGVEERESKSGGVGSFSVLLVYFSAAHVPAAEILELGDSKRRVRVHGPEGVPETDWESAWRDGLEPRQVGPLWIRPSWCASKGSPEIQIDPEQAFGSGEHASTRMALALVLDALVPGDRVLDLGAGSGILGLGALRVGAGAAFGVDIDRRACVNAAANGARNGLPLALVCGTLAAVSPRARFEIVVANVLLRHLEPWLPRLAGQTSRALVLSGYLVEEREELRELMRARGFVAKRELEEDQSGDTWCASLWGHSRALQSASKSSSVSSNR